MKRLMIRLLTRDDGQDLIEYGLLIGIITLAAVVAVVSIGGKVNAYFTNVDALMP
jgi:pilus assembly protein Flp/PilA